LARHSALALSTEPDIVAHLGGFGSLDPAFPNTASPDPNWPRNHTIDRIEFLQFLGDSVGALIATRVNGKRWIDTPPDCLKVDILADAFRDSLFLLILRDGRTAVSAAFRGENEAENSLHGAVGRPTEIQSAWKACRRSIRTVTDALAYDPHVRLTEFRSECWRWARNVTSAMAFVAGRPGRCRTVRYEELIADPDGGFRGIFRFFGLPVDAEPIHSFRLYRDSSHQALGASSPTTARQPLAVWKEWTVQQQQVFLEVAGETLLRYGFVTEHDILRLQRDAAG